MRLDRPRAESCKEAEITSVRDGVGADVWGARPEDVDGPGVGPSEDVGCPDGPGSGVPSAWARVRGGAVGDVRRAFAIAASQIRRRAGVVRSSGFTSLSTMSRNVPTNWPRRRFLRNSAISTTRCESVSAATSGARRLGSSRMSFTSSSIVARVALRPDPPRRPTRRKRH